MFTLNETIPEQYNDQANRVTQYCYILREIKPHSDRASLVFFDRSFIITNTSMYDVMQNSAVIPV